jgi:hypothetical protein
MEAVRGVPNWPLVPNYPPFLYVCEGGTGSSSSCSSDSYRGPSAASEPETQAIKAIFQQFESRVAMYLSVHAFSQFILLPWFFQSSSSAINAWHVCSLE